MKISILLIALLGSFGGFAQNLNSKSPQSDQARESNTHYYVEQHSLAGYWYISTIDPLIVNADPVISDPIYTATAIPNQVTESLTVDFGDEIPKERITVAISDTVDYRLLKSASFVPKHKEHAVSLDSLKKGSYHVVVFRDDNRVLYMGDFKKQ